MTLATTRESVILSEIANRIRLYFGPGALRLCLAAGVGLSHLSGWDYGRPAVMLFFILSGYWVTRMREAQSHQEYSSYLLSRFLRIWPLMAITSALAIAAFTYLGIHYQGSPLSTIALIGLSTRQNDFVGTIWSLDIESQFYIILPLLLLWPRFFRSWLNVAAAFSISMVGFWLFSRWTVITVLFYFPMFAIGIAIYQNRFRVSGRAALLSATIGFSVLTTIIFPPLHFAAYAQVIRDAVFMFVAAIFSPFVAWTLGLASNNMDRHLGNLSYPIYLVHKPCIIIMAAMVGGIWGKLAAVVATLIVSTILYFVVDRQIELFRSKRNSPITGLAIQDAGRA